MRREKGGAASENRRERSLKSEAWSGARRLSLKKITMYHGRIVFALPRYTDTIVESIILHHVDQFWRGSGESDNGECCEDCVPQCKYASQLELRSVRHVMLPAENQDHVNATVVEAVCPVVRHPYFRVQVSKGLLEVEDVRVVGHSYIHVIHFVHLGIFFVLSVVHKKTGERERALFLLPLLLSEKE